jgi:hypothetical protein
MAQRQNKRQRYEDSGPTSYASDDLQEVHDLLKLPETLLSPALTALFSLYRNKIDKSIKDNVIVVHDVEDMYVEQMSLVMDCLPHFEPQQILSVLSRTKGSVERAIDILLTEGAEHTASVTNSVPTTDQVIDLQLIEQQRAFLELLPSKLSLMNEIRQCENTYARHFALKKQLEIEKSDLQIDIIEEDAEEEQKQLSEKIKNERRLIEKRQQEERMSLNVKFYVKGELEVLNNYLRNKVNNIHRVKLTASHTFDCLAEEIHFRIAESQFVRSNTPVNIDFVEYIVNPKTVFEFQQKKEELAKKHGFRLESMKPLLLFQ